MTDIRAVLRDTASPYVKKDDPSMRKINVVAFGGLGGSLFSTGLKTILMRLNGVPEIDYMTFEDYTSWRHWAGTIAKWKDDTVFLGHSYGVAAMFGCIRAMGSKGPAVPLCISFDPSQWTWLSIPLWGSGGNAVPDRVQKVSNFYQSSGLIGRQTLQRESGSTAGITNFPVKGVSHGSIEDDPMLQKLAVDDILKVARA